MALTLATDLQQATSAYKNISMEDFLDVLDQIEPAETPFTALTDNEVALGSTEFAKNVDSYSIVGGAVGVGDGQTVASGDVTNYAANIRKIGNIAQAHREVVGVGWIAQQLPKVAGVSDLSKHVKRKAIIHLKKKMEMAFCSLDQTAVSDGGAYLGAIGAGYRKLVDYANRYTAASAFAFGKPSDLHYAPTGASVTGALATVHTRAMWKTVSKALRTAAQQNTDWTLLAGLNLRQAVTDLTNPTTTTTTAAATGTGAVVSNAADQIRVLSRAETDTTLGVVIDIIQTDFGRIIVKDTDWIGTTTTDSTGGALTGWASASGQRVLASFVSKPNCGLILKRGNVFKRWGIPVYTKELAYDGGGDKLDVKGLCALGVRNPILGGFLELT